MCIIAVVPAGKVLRDEVLHNCWTLNHMGAGFAYPLDGKLRVVKELRSQNKFEYLFKKHQELAPESPFVLHWRIRTHGEVSLANVHPFWVNKDMVMFHNGTITGMPDDKVRSDSNLFNHLVLQKLPKGWSHNRTILQLIQERINGSRMVFLTSTGRIVILNKQAWSESEDGILFSNDGWLGSWLHRSKGHTLYVLDKDSRQWVKTDSIQKKISSPSAIRAEYDKLLLNCDPCTKHASGSGQLIQVIDVEQPDLILHISKTTKCFCCQEPLGDYTIISKIMGGYACEECLLETESIAEKYKEGVRWQ